MCCIMQHDHKRNGKEFMLFYSATVHKELLAFLLLYGHYRRCDFIHTEQHRTYMYTNTN